MPGSNLSYSTNPESFDSTPASITSKAKMATQTPNKTVVLNTYTPQNFMEVKKHEMFGPRISRREQRKFNEYLFSPQGMQEAVAFHKAEQLKAQAASDYVASRNIPVLNANMPSMPSIASNEQIQAALNVINQPMKAPISKPINTAYWNSRANMFGFNNMDEVKAWQQQNGLVADGMFGKNSEAKWRSMQEANPKLVSRTITTVDGTPMDIIKKEGNAVEADWKKQGGIMNRINYFQQGGAAPQQDIKAQITALVQAAM